MNPKDVLDAVDEHLGEIASDACGAVVLIKLDRAADLRDRFGFAGLFGLIDEMGKILRKRSGRRARVLRFGLDSFIVAIAARRAIDAEKRAGKLFD
ncbi:MAG: hypothetical protein ACOCSR_00300, partial [Wenzhouxiangella sp.]